MQGDSRQVCYGRVCKGAADRYVMVGYARHTLLVSAPSQLDLLDKAVCADRVQEAALNRHVKDARGLEER